MKKCILFLLLFFSFSQAFGWGFYAHRKINYYAVFLLPPEMLAFYKPQIDFLSEHAVDPDKRRYAAAEEGARHYIDIDHYGSFPFSALPRNWNEAREKYGEDSLQKYGIGPWWLQVMMQRLTAAFRSKDALKILKYSAEIGHYMADLHVPLHTNSNHNGQLSNQHGIHGFWESRIPELLAENEAGGWDFFIGKAIYIKDLLLFTWKKVLESAIEADSVLQQEKFLSSIFPADKKFAFEERNGVVLKQYSGAFARAYDKRLGGMVERRMRESIFAVASSWYTAWVNAGQPDLLNLVKKDMPAASLQEWEELNKVWRSGTVKGREHE